MPVFQKKVLSAYIRNGCKRRLRLSMYPADRERLANGMPETQKARAGVGIAGQLGYDWQEEKVDELVEVFGVNSVLQQKGGPKNRALPQDLLALINIGLQAHQFIVEAKYSSDTASFRQGMGLVSIVDENGESLDLSYNHADLIQVLPSRSEALPDEKLEYRLEVHADGSLSPIDDNDNRLRLRVIDIKLAAEPGAHYFAEVVYYAITLAAWLHENNLTDQFAVVAASAVWPGSYEASAVMLARQELSRRGIPVTLANLAKSLEDDLELAPFDTFVARLRRFFVDVLPEVLTTPWQQLPWHVDYGCSGCEFLGYPWPMQDGTLDHNPLWCWPEAARTGHTSQVVGLSRGNRQQLGAPTVAQLALFQPDHELFRRTPSLRIQRERFPGRAESLLTNTATVLPNSGSDALMPRWPDLHVYLFLDYDLASAITVTFGIRAFWLEPVPFGVEHADEKHRKQWNEQEGDTEIFVVDTRNLDRERSEFLNFLRTLRGILDEVRRFDTDDITAGRRTDPSNPNIAPKRSSYQIFLWDEAQRRQLQRVAGRHLPAILADPRIRDLAWLFPPPELLSNYEEASVRSPFTLVSRVVQNTIAVNLPHHYTLSGVAQQYHTPEYTPPAIFTLYQDPLSDLIPGERIHELWTRRGQWRRILDGIQQTTRYKLLALGAVVTRLERDLQDGLLPARLAAPVLEDRAPRPLAGLPPFSLLLYEFTRLNAALQDLQVYAVRAMPAHEREARFKSAYLPLRLEGADRATALTQLSEAAGKILSTGPELWIYTLGDDSHDLNVRPGDIGFALSPRSRPDFLVQSPYAMCQPDYKVEGMGAMAKTVADAGLTGVSIEAIDRQRGLIALKVDHVTYLTRKDDSGKGNARIRYTVEQAGLVDLSFDVMLDPVEKDYLASKVELTLIGIGYPELARDQDNATIRTALGLPSATAPPSFSLPTPVAHFLWDGSALAASALNRNLPTARPPLEAVLQARGQNLNFWQWAAWTSALSTRLSLIWGPPGTGKSQTLRALVVGALLDAYQRGVPLRVLISAQGYSAIDNILYGLPALLRDVMSGVPIDLIRLQGHSKDTPADLPVSIQPMIPLTTQAPAEVQQLQAQLTNPSGLTVVGGIPHQIHNLAVSTRNKTAPTRPLRAVLTQREWFDLIIIDEASQMDVASATLVLSKATADGAYVLAGDDLQLPPIHQAEAPKHLEQHVGSAFEYARHVQQISPLPLNENYRSNATLVDFIRTAGYDLRLQAFSPNLRLNLPPLPVSSPADWPTELAWSVGLVQLLDPAFPATAFTYNDDTSGQVNDFEADTIAAMVWLLRGQLRRQLLHELRPDGSEKPITNEIYDAQTDFWEKAIGIVTPHRAQMSRIVTRLQQLFPSDNPEKIRAAVDTVERFQGQQRDVIMASFGIGDPDLIRSEDEFLYSLRRFNVLASRARAKLIVLASQSLVDHLSDDAQVLEESRLLKRFVESYCLPGGSLTLAYQTSDGMIEQSGYLYQR